MKTITENSTLADRLISLLSQLFMRHTGSEKLRKLSKHTSKVESNSHTRIMSQSRW